MMLWYDHGMNGWGWAAMTIGMVLFWGLLITVGVLVFRANNHDHSSRGPGTAPPADAPQTRPDPEQVLAERYARGEIDDDEYPRRLTTLHAPGTGTAT